MTIGIGGNIEYTNGFLPVSVPTIFPDGLPAIATGAVAGVFLHVVFGGCMEKGPEATISTQTPIGPPDVREFFQRQHVY